MDEYIKKIEDYVVYKEHLRYRELLGSSLTFEEIKELEVLKEEAMKAKYFLEEENKRIKKLIKSIK